MQSRARGGDDLRTATIDTLYNDVDYTEPRDDPDFGLRGHDECAYIEYEYEEEESVDVPDAGSSDESLEISSAAAPRRSGPLPLHPDDALSQRQQADANFDALVVASDVKYGRRHLHDEELALCESLLDASDLNSAAALNMVLLRATNQNVGELLRAFCEVPRVQPTLESSCSKAGKAAPAYVVLTNTDSSSSGSSSPVISDGSEASPAGDPLLGGSLKRQRVVRDDEEPHLLEPVAGDASGEEEAVEEEEEEEEKEEEEEAAMDEEGAEADEPTGPAGCRFLQREAEASDGSDDDSADEDASDADSDGNLKGFTVKDDEASESNYETDEELETPPARRRQKGTREAAAAEALLGCRLEGLKVMRLEAQRARDVVDGEKTLELTGKHCHWRGVVLVGETAEGASAKGCAIGAVTLGECASLNRGSFEATAARHRALDFPPALAWLEQGTLHAQVRHPTQLPRLLTLPRLP